jgi:hypothetical protein
MRIAEAPAPRARIATQLRSSAAAHACCGTAPAEAAFTKGDRIERFGRQWVVYAVDPPPTFRGPTVMRLRGYDERVQLREPAEACEAP